MQCKESIYVVDMLMFSVWYEISFAEVILHWGLSLKLPHVASYVSVCVPNLCLLILFLGLVTSLPSWFRPSLRSSFVWGMIHVESTEFSTQLMHVFSKEMQLDKADEMEEVTHVFHAAIAFFLECVWELPVMSGFCFFNVQCYFGTIFTIYSPLMYYEWIHEIVGWWHHFPTKM